MYENENDVKMKISEKVILFQCFASELCFYKDILLRGNRIVIPQRLRRLVLEAAHEGHPGISAMKDRLRTKVWWPKIDAELMYLSLRSRTTWTDKTT